MTEKQRKKESLDLLKALQNITKQVNYVNMIPITALTAFWTGPGCDMSVGPVGASVAVGAVGLTWPGLAGTCVPRVVFSQGISHHSLRLILTKSSVL